LAPVVPPVGLVIVALTVTGVVVPPETVAVKTPEALMRSATVVEVEPAVTVTRKLLPDSVAVSLAPEVIEMLYELAPVPAVAAVSNNSAALLPADVVTAEGRSADALIVPAPVSAPLLPTENNPLNVVLALKA
jgi:hypothetical protein